MQFKDWVFVQSPNNRSTLAQQQKLKMHNILPKNCIQGANFNNNMLSMKEEGGQGTSAYIWGCGSILNTLGYETASLSSYQVTQTSNDVIYCEVTREINIFESNTKHILAFWTSNILLLGGLIVLMFILYTLNLIHFQFSFVWSFLYWSVSPNG